MTTRIALIEPQAGDGGDLRKVERYLPFNYRAVQTKDHGILIIGEDSAGWTLDGYVIPRLASGLIAARELDGLTGDLS